MAERLVVDQGMCDKAKLMLAGGGSQVQVAQLLGISESTVSRIKKAGFDRATFYANNDRRRIEDNNKRADEKLIKAINQLREEQKEEKKELPGQVKMELVYDPDIAEEYRKEQKSEDNSMMRFQAKQVGLLLQKMEKMNDTMNMILRCIRRE